MFLEFLSHKRLFIGFVTKFAVLFSVVSFALLRVYSYSTTSWNLLSYKRLTDHIVQTTPEQWILKICNNKLKFIIFFLFLCFRYELALTFIANLLRVNFECKTTWRCHKFQLGIGFEGMYVLVYGECDKNGDVIYKLEKNWQLKKWFHFNNLWLIIASIANSILCENVLQK